MNSVACTIIEMESRTVTASVGVILLTLVGIGTSNHCSNSDGKYISTQANACAQEYNITMHICGLLVRYIVYSKQVICYIMDLCN